MHKVIYLIEVGADLANVRELHLCTTVHLFREPLLEKHCRFQSLCQPANPRPPYLLS
jgi:hypothetical protein